MLAGLLLAGVWGGAAWRMARGPTTLEARLRPGSLRCQDECHFELTLEDRDGTRVRADECLLPDSLRDYPDQSIELLVAGHWQSDRSFKATFLATKHGRPSSVSSSSGRPPACFVPAPKR